MSQEREHTRFSPSRSEQFFHCPGVVNLLARVPALPSDEYSAEGTKAHDVLEAGLSARVFNAKQAKDISIHCVDDFESSFYTALDTAFDYINLILDDLHLKYGDAQMFVETRVNPPIQCAPGEAAGYCDVAIVSRAARKLWVMDYKHGVGISKGVEDNTQVRQYAAGFVYDEESPIKDILHDIDEVVLVIIQPRSFHKDGDIREHTVKVTELFDYLMLLEEKIEASLQPDAPLVVNHQKQCRTCEAKAGCPAMQTSMMNALVPTATRLGEVNQKSIGDVDLMTPERLAYIHSMAPMMKSLLAAVERRLEHMLKEGVQVPGLKLVESKAMRRWHGEENERIVKLSALMGVPADELYDISAKPITEVEEMMVEQFKKRVGRKQKRKAAEDAKQLFAYFTTKESSGKLTMVPEDDKRPAVDRVASYFAHVNVLPPPNSNN